ncbi:MAG: hypothetical protein QHH07_02340 [Sedimentisphaerales bacterium]|nr:hypothetical protein [Sedimentisphaerales bacterium]
MERPRRHRSRQSAMGSRQKDYVMVTAVEDWEQAYQIQQMLQDHEIPATIKEHQGLGDQPSWAVMVPEEYLDEAHVIVESESSYQDPYQWDEEDQQIDGFEDLFDQ